MSSNQVIRDLCNKTIQEAAPRRQKFLQSANAQAGEPSISSLYHTMVVYGLEVVEDEGKAQLARKILEHHEQEPGEDLEPFCRKLIEREKQASPPNHMCANPLEFPLKYAMWQGERKFVDQLFLKLEIHVASIKSAKHTIGQRSEEMAEYLMTKGGGTK